MATLHRIVLAIASSWNNGTSSPAPQGGNRALSNETNALASAFAERQAQPSAKTPPIPNPIGKGIGKFWIPILLATATALSTIPIEQLEAASASTNQITRPTLPSYRSKSPTASTNRVIPSRSRSIATRSRAVPTYRPSTNRVARPPARTARTNQVQTPSRRTRTIPVSTTRSRTRPAALPLAAPAAPVIKKAVLHAGTYLVCAVGEWFIGKQMDKLTKAEVDKAAGQTATCGVESILWERNSTKVTTRAIAGFSNMWGLLTGQSTTLSVRQGQEDTAASGTFQGPTLNRTLTSAQAKSHLHHARGTLVMSTYELINSRGRIDTVTISAREDKVADQNNKLIQRVRRRTGDSSWRFYRHIDERKVEYNVDSYRVTSDFDDPIPTYSKLREPGEDERAHSYEATVTWKMRPLQEDGRWGPEKKMKHTFPKGDTEGNGDLRLPSYEDSSFPFDFCDSNQRISDLYCRAFINRRVMDRDITEIKHVWQLVGLSARGTVAVREYGWRLEETKIGTERIVVHDSN